VAERLGPLVHRIVRPGASMLLVGSSQFIVAMIVVQLKFPGYSDFSNAISDLGGPNSPDAIVFNISIRVLGALGVLATILIRSTFPARWSARLGLLFLVIASLGAFLVGTFPEGSTWPFAGIHSAVSLVTFLGSGLALLTLSLGMLRDTRWDGYRFYTFLSGLVTLVALGLFASSVYVGLGLGGMERLVVAPILLWALVVGVHLARMPVYAPSLLKHLVA
jgi:hypothetical membrane protein